MVMIFYSFFVSASREGCKEEVEEGMCEYLSYKFTISRMFCCNKYLVVITVTIV